MSTSSLPLPRGNGIGVYSIRVAMGARGDRPGGTAFVTIISQRENRLYAYAPRIRLWIKLASSHSGFLVLI